MSETALHVVLVSPEIPPNTGNIARLCMATRTVLHLIDPLGFELSDRTLRRAGMDYWDHLEWYRWPDWPAFLASRPECARLWLVESGGGRHHAEVTYRPGDLLVFGRETKGLPKPILETYSEQWIRIPMAHPEARSLNLSNCAAIVLYEALRQLGFPACDAGK